MRTIQLYHTHEMVSKHGFDLVLEPSAAADQFVYLPGTYGDKDTVFHRLLGGADLHVMSSSHDVKTLAEQWFEQLK